MNTPGDSGGTYADREFDRDNPALGRTMERVGNMFICGSGGCDIRQYGRLRTPRDMAGLLLEDVGEWMSAVKELPDDYTLPPGISAALWHLHDAVAAWIDLLERGGDPDDIPPPPRPGPPDKPRRMPLPPELKLIDLKAA